MTPWTSPHRVARVQVWGLLGVPHSSSRRDWLTSGALLASRNSFQGRSPGCWEKRVSLRPRRDVARGSATHKPRKPSPASGPHRRALPTCPHRRLGRLVGVGQEGGHRSSWYPGWKEEYGGPAFQLSNARVPCARPQAEARPQVGSGALPSPSVRSAPYRDGWGPCFRRKGLGPEREVMRHLIRGGGGLLLCGSGGQGGAGRGRSLRHLHHFAQQGVSHPSWAQRSPGPPHQITH